jgi:hypothetical protein
MGLFSKTPKPRSPDDQRMLNDRLIDAAKEGDTKEVLALLTAGANVHAGNDRALCLAAYYGNAETARVLLEAGSNVRASDDYPLCYAVINDHTEIVQVLAEHIFAPGSWRGRSRAEIEEQASALYEKIKTQDLLDPIPLRDLRKLAAILFECATDCWLQVRPVPKLKISLIPAQPRPL